MRPNRCRTHRYLQGTRRRYNYAFYSWRLIDSFCYFSHHRVTVPPVGWINAAHRNGVPVLGESLLSCPRIHVAAVSTQPVGTPPRGSLADSDVRNATNVVCAYEIVIALQYVRSIRAQGWACCIMYGVLRMHYISMCKHTSACAWELKTKLFAILTILRVMSMIYKVIRSLHKNSTNRDIHLCMSWPLATVLLPWRPFSYPGDRSLTLATVLLPWLPFSYPGDRSLTLATVLLPWRPFSYPGDRSLTLATVLLPWRPFSYPGYRSLTLATVLLPSLPFSYPGDRSLTLATVLLPWRPFSYPRYRSLTLARIYVVPEANNNSAAASLLD